jgi:hypothetical protein
MPTIDMARVRETVQSWIDMAVQAGSEQDTYNSRRGNLRTDWYYPLELLVGDKVYYANARDISETGIGLVCRQSLDVETDIFVRRDENDPWVPCRVRHVTETIGASKVGVEVSFELEG